jgi:cell division protein FtsL
VQLRFKALKRLKKYKMRSSFKNPEKENKPDSETVLSVNPEQELDNRKIYLALLYLLVILIVLVMLFLHIKQHYRMTSIKHQISMYERETQRLNKQIENLEIQISKLSALERIEKTAREKLQMVAPDKIKYFDPSGQTGEVLFK